ncbi:MAG: pyruvate dehydrogenase (acetyl-transferring) E1 component subunit alpha [Verrucomicrobiota bacterium]|nr:pyruvate dehydrogenase (acetyl-transferring) E1 component subunit alpha [Verrucomicrobiota bacterium]
MEGLHHDTNLEPVPTGDKLKFQETQKPETKVSVPEDSSNENFASSLINQNLSSEDKIELFDQMVRIRRFEERSLRAYQQGNIGGFLHLYIGQEAVAVGSVSVLGEDDHVITAYRDHGHALAVGMNMDECMAELYGKKTGCSKGKGGSMHFFAPDKNFWGGHGIVGGQTPLGLGLAYALKHFKKKGSCLCFMGDGATNQGPFYESLNLAALWELPVVYVIENNGYSMGTAEGRHSAGEPLARRGECFDISWKVAHGHNLYEVRSVVKEAVDRAHLESKPTVLEIVTYRYRGHSVADPDQTYRSKEEIEEYKKNKDPINLFKDILISENVLTEDRALEIDKLAKEEANASAEFAAASPDPDPSELMDDIYWETDNPEFKTSEGRIFFEHP